MHGSLCAHEGEHLRCATRGGTHFKGGIGTVGSDVRIRVSPIGENRRMNRIKAVFFDVDNTLHDSTRQVGITRRNAVRAMIEAGLDVDEETALTKLREIVKKHGPNYGQHFDRLLEVLDYKHDAHIIAAGVVTYHNTKIAHLVPFPDTIPTLISLRDQGYMLGVITDGLPVKQWEKLIRLGLQHFFHTVVISEEVGGEKPEGPLFKTALERIGCMPEEAVMVGDRLDRDIEGANKVGLTTVQILHGKYSGEKAANELQKPDYIIQRLRDLPTILRELEE